VTATREPDRSAGVVAVAGEALVEAAPGGRPANVAVGPHHAARAMLQRLLARTRDAITVAVSYETKCRQLLMGSPEAARRRIEALVGPADVVKASADDLPGCCLAARPSRSPRRGWQRVPRWS
jgi:hypothetical protein